MFNMTQQQLVEWWQETFSNSEVEFVAFTKNQENDQWDIIRRTRPPTIMSWQVSEDAASGDVAGLREALEHAREYLLDGGPGTVTLAIGAISKALAALSQPQPAEPDAAPVELEQIITWLRQQTHAPDSYMLADAIERGDHLQGASDHGR